MPVLEFIKVATTDQLPAGSTLGIELRSETQRSPAWCALWELLLAPARDQLLAGDGITEPLAASGLFSPLLIQLVKVGEETGTLDRYLEQASDFMDSDLDYRTKQMVTIIEPMLIVGVAAMVGFVALSVVLPMYGILQSIR